MLELVLKEIVGRHAKENSASEKVMKKLGFQYVKDIPYEGNAGTKIYEGKELNKGECLSEFGRGDGFYGVLY